MIYYIEDVQTIEMSDLQDMLAFVSRERLERIERYRLIYGQVQSVLAYLLFRYGLIRDYGITEIPTIAKEKMGKPFLPQFSDLHFNLSHCRTAVACGFSSKPIGVDVQHLVPYKESVVRFFMTPTEAEQISRADESREFTRMWTVKESYGKYLGMGIRYPMSSTTVAEGTDPRGFFIKSYCMKDYYLSVCAEEEQNLCEVSYVQLKEFWMKRLGCE